MKKLLNKLVVATIVAIGLALCSVSILLSVWSMKQLIQWGRNKL